MKSSSFIFCIEFIVLLMSECSLVLLLDSLDPLLLYKFSLFVGST